MKPIKKATYSVAYPTLLIALLMGCNKSVDIEPATSSSTEVKDTGPRMVGLPPMPEEEQMDDHEFLKRTSPEIGEYNLTVVTTDPEFLAWVRKADLSPIDEIAHLYAGDISNKDITKKLIELYGKEVEAVHSAISIIPPTTE